MPRIFQLAAFIVLTLWVPATVHCGLEAAGLIPMPPEAADSCCNHEKACSHDDCSAIEKGGFTANASSLKVLPPVQIDWAGASYLSLLVELPPPEDVTWAVPDDRPHDWVSDWYFARRAACPPRAPSLNA